MRTRQVIYWVFVASNPLLALGYLLSIADDPIRFLMIFPITFLALVALGGDEALGDKLRGKLLYALMLIALAVEAASISRPDLWTPTDTFTAASLLTILSCIHGLRRPPATSTDSSPA